MPIDWLPQEPIDEVFAKKKETTRRRREENTLFVVGVVAKAAKFTFLKHVIYNYFKTCKEQYNRLDVH